MMSNSPSGVKGRKKFWNIFKPFLTSQGFTDNETLPIDINIKILKEEIELSKKLNSFCNNVGQT